jgi:hypothetical protein
MAAAAGAVCAESGKAVSAANIAIAARDGRRNGNRVSVDGIGK